MKHWLFPSRVAEATPQQLVATGASGSGYVQDPVDGDYGYMKVGGGGPREQPWWTTTKARAFTIAGWRANPMARAVIDTYTSFCVGDSGVSIECDVPEVRDVLDEWWEDPRNQLDNPRRQTLMCRDWLLHGEFVNEMLVGPETGVVRFSPIDPDRIQRVELLDGNPLWHKELWLKGRDEPLDIVNVDDFTGLRTGRVIFLPSWQATLTDTRGTPFLQPILDDLDAYQEVLSNLVDRTKLARYFVWDVNVDGTQDDVDAFVKARGGLHVPRSATVEAHNNKVTWTAKTVDTGSFEDTNTAQSLLTNVAGGAGLAKTWLAESDGANRATALSMAEPVRRRVGGVQNDWLGNLSEFAKFVVDQAVAVGRLPRLVQITNERGEPVMVRPSRTVRVKGPEIAGADAQVASTIFLNLSTALDQMVATGVLSKPAATVAVQKAWEQLVGQPWRPSLAAGADSAPTDVNPPA